MKDINYPLRKAYFRALQATGLPVYYQSLPNNINPANYLIFRSIISNDASTKSSAETSSNITVEIHTLRDVINPGLDADLIAEQVYTYIYAISQFVLPMDGLLMCSTKMVLDTSQNIQLNNQQAYINRFITFRHHIFVSSSSGGGTIVTTGGSIERFEYTTTLEQTSFTNTDLIGKKILLFVKDGVEFSRIIFSGSPADKQVLYDSPSGYFEWAIPSEPGEEIIVVYQNL